VTVDVVNQLGVAALLGSSSKKQGIRSTSKLFTSFRISNIIKHMKEQQGKKWVEYLELIKVTSNWQDMKASLLNKALMHL
jgi:hypothetical protein